MPQIRVTLDVQVEDADKAMRLLNRERDKIADFVAYVLMEDQKVEPNGAHQHAHVPDEYCATCNVVSGVSTLQRG